MNKLFNNFNYPNLGKNIIILFYNIFSYNYSQLIIQNFAWI